MKPEKVYAVFNTLAEDPFTFLCLGEFDDELTPSLLRISESAIQEAKTFKRKVSLLIAECFQNILRHPDKPAVLNRTNNKPKMFLVRNRGSEFYIASANLIDNTKKAELEARLRSIGAFSREDLKAEYLRALESNPVSDKGGAGLGLLVMAMKSDEMPEFEFEMVNYFYSVFYIQLCLTGQGTPQGDKAGSLLPLNSTVDLYHQMAEEQVILLRKGDFSQQTILPLIELLEKNPIRKKILYILIELLQNLSKHSGEFKGKQDGIFILSVDEQQYTLSTGNYIKNDRVDALNKQLKLLKSMNPEKLEEVYNSAILSKEGSGENSECAGLGLMDIFKNCGGKITYDFIPVSEGISFFIFTAAV